MLVVLFLSSAFAHQKDEDVISEELVVGVASSQNSVDHVRGYVGVQNDVSRIS